MKVHFHFLLKKKEKKEKGFLKQLDTEDFSKSSSAFAGLFSVEDLVLGINSRNGTRGIDSK